VPGHPAAHPGPLTFVADVDAPVLAADEDHHLRRVLRLRVGAPLTVGDGRGRWRPAVLTTDGLEPTGPVEAVPAPDPVLTVGFALVKGEKPELVVQKLTEVGVDRIVPLRAARSVVRWDADKADKAVARLRLVARAAAAQAHRPHLPVVAEVADLADLVALAADPGGGAGPALAGREGGSLEDGHTTLLVGPEGGWAPEELGLGLPVVRLGPHVLRAETAAIAAGVLLVAHHRQ
jgi:16S rRNA (uracil1498-N3)-methyltransferase